MDIIGRRYWFFAVSLAILVPGIISLLIPPGLRAGIEFTGGSTMSVEFAQAVKEGDLHTTLASLGHPEAVIQRLGSEGYFIRTATLREAKRDSQGNVVAPAEQDVIKEALAGLSPLQAFQFASVSPVVARQTVRNAAVAVIVASLAIMLYITWAFRKVPSPFRYGVCAVVALLHDVVLVMGVFSLASRFVSLEVNAMFISGILTVVGYSVNDTVVVFDRIRENVARTPGADLETTVNTSLLETLGRSLNTTLTTLIAIAALLLFGGASIRTLILVMFVGVATGAYSSIGVASSMLVSWEKGEFGRLLRRLHLAPARRSAA